MRWDHPTDPLKALALGGDCQGAMYDVQQEEQHCSQQQDWDVLKVPLAVLGLL